MKPNSLTMIPFPKHLQLITNISNNNKVKSLSYKQSFSPYRINNKSLSFSTSKHNLNITNSIISISKSTRTGCRFCFELNQFHSTLISPCNCKGTTKYVHQKCLQKWIRCSYESKQNPQVFLYELFRPKCELCQFEFVMEFKVTEHFSCQKIKEKLKYIIFAIFIIIALVVGMSAVIVYTILKVYKTISDYTKMVMYICFGALDFLLIIFCTIGYYWGFKDFKVKRVDKWIIHNMNSHYAKEEIKQRNIMKQTENKTIMITTTGNIGNINNNSPIVIHHNYTQTNTSQNPSMQQQQQQQHQIFYDETSEVIRRSHPSILSLTPIPH